MNGALMEPLEHERLARLEVNMASVMKWVEHIDACVDSLKVTIWRAAGALGAIVFVIELVVRMPK